MKQINFEFFDQGEQLELHLTTPESAKQKKMQIEDERAMPSNENVAISNQGMTF